MAIAAVGANEKGKLALRDPIEPQRALVGIVQFINTVKRPGGST
jgi:hypothetical protein